ncbi:IZUMO family member 4, partial [Chelydra serpentina]
GGSPLSVTPRGAGTRPGRAAMGAARRLLGLWLAAALALGAARACLQCDPAFAARFAAYRPRLSRKSWGLGDVPAAGQLLRGWARDTVRGLRLSIPAEIPLDKLHEIAAKVYEKLDILLNGQTYQPGILSQPASSEPDPAATESYH